MRVISLCCALAVTALPFGAAVAQGPSGIALSWTCAGCHGTDGSSAGPSSPSIAAMDADVFVDAMQDYKADRRNSTIMNRIAKGYTDQQITAMAEFFARQPLRARPQEHDAAKASLGSELHQKYCEKCHEDGGRPGDSGILAGQWLPYLEFAMADFLAGRREWPRKMKKKVDDAIEYKGADAIPALLHYYASQH